MVIVSNVAGRIRVRSRRLKSAEFARSVKADLETYRGVTHVQANPRAGSVAVLFDTDAVNAEKLEKRIEQACMPVPGRASRDSGSSTRLSTTLNRATKIGMMTTLSASLAYAAKGDKKPHIRFGIGFLAFAGLHMLRYSNRLLR
jgi:copper chaperone CopZ